MAQFCSHKEPIYSLEFSRDNAVLASGNQHFYTLKLTIKKFIYFFNFLITQGGLDNTVKVWNMAKLVKEVEQSEDLSKFSTRNESQFEIGSWQTKQTPIIQLHFTRRNLLVGIGPFKHN